LSATGTQGGSPPPKAKTRGSYRLDLKGRPAASRGSWASWPVGVGRTEKKDQECSVQEGKNPVERGNRWKDPKGRQKGGKVVQQTVPIRGLRPNERGLREPSRTYTTWAGGGGGGGGGGGKKKTTLQGNQIKKSKKKHNFSGVERRVTKCGIIRIKKRGCLVNLTKSDVGE